MSSLGMIQPPMLLNFVFVEHGKLKNDVILGNCQDYLALVKKDLFTPDRRHSKTLIQLYATDKIMYSAKQDPVLILLDYLS